VLAFISQKGVSFTWTVVPSEDPDHYRITLQADFETVVPWPSLEIQPAGIDLCEYSGGAQHTVYFTITNGSLINAEALELNFPSHPAWEITTPLGSQMGTLAAHHGIVVPVFVRQIAPNGNVPSAMEGNLYYEFRGNNIVFPRSVPVPVWDANVWDCTNAPLVTITPRDLDMCSFTQAINNVNFTIHNLSALPIDGLNFSFDSHVHWQIVPATTNLGTLAGNTSIVVPVQFIRTASPVSGQNPLKGRLAFQATLQNETRHFKRVTTLYNPNPWDCVPSPLVTLEPTDINLCALTQQSNPVSFTITNHSLFPVDGLNLAFGTHPRWQINPLVSNLGTLPPRSSMVISVLFQKVSTSASGPSSIDAHLGYAATVEGETRSFSQPLTVRNPNPCDCLPNPPVTIGPQFVDLCALRAATNTINFTIHNRSSAIAEDARLQFGTHPRWRIQPSATDFGSLLPGANFTVPVSFIQISTNEGSSYIGASFSYHTSVEIQRCDFSPPIVFYDANISDFIPPFFWATNGPGTRDYHYLFVTGTVQL